MSLAIAAFREERMDELVSKCYCGGNSKLEYRNKTGRFAEATVFVKSVPVFVCECCGESFMSGPVSLRYAELIRVAVEVGLTDIEFK